MYLASRPHRAAPWRALRAPCPPLRALQVCTCVRTFVRTYVRTGTSACAYCYVRTYVAWLRDRREGGREGREGREGGREGKE